MPDFGNLGTVALPGVLVVALVYVAGRFVLDYLKVRRNGNGNGHNAGAVERERVRLAEAAQAVEYRVTHAEQQLVEVQTRVGELGKSVDRLLDRIDRRYDRPAVP